MNRLADLLDRVKHPAEFPQQRARRRYLEALRRRQPFAAIRSSEVPNLEAVTHIACGLRHLPWEYCPAAEPPLRVGRVSFSK